MNESDLLSDKFTTAKLPDIYAPRHTLINLFHKETSKRIIYVSAPAGYGKTISTRLWLESTDFVPVWIELDEYDNTPSIFYKLFCTGILSLQPNNKAMAAVLASPAFASSPVEHTIQLLAEFVPDSRQYVIVLDDMHLVSNMEIRKSGLLVQKRLPPYFIVVILTRNEVAEEYASITGRERCAIITAQDLAFSTEEIQKYFNAHGHFVTAEEAAVAHAITNGWAIGVNALAISGQMELGQKSGQILEDYIKTQIWDKWDENLKNFLLKTSIVDEMSIELCAELTGCENAHEILDSLCAMNAFVNRLSDTIYRYHHLFLDFLRSQALQAQIDTETLYGIAAKYYIGLGEYFIARRYAIKGGNIGAQLEIIQKLTEYGSACMDEFASFSKLHANEALSERICDKAPFFYALQMWENYLLGNAEKMEYYMDKVYQFLPVIASNFPEYLGAVMIQITLDHRIPLSVQLERFASLPPVEHLHGSQQGATLTHELPFLHRGNRDYYELADDAVCEKLWMACGPLLKRNLEIMLLGIKSGLLLEKNRIKQATDAALMAISLINEYTSDEIRFSTSIHLAQACYVAGDSQWERVMAEAEGSIEKRGAHYLRPNFLAYRTRILLSNADKSAASDWIANYFVTEAEHLELYKIFQYFTTARAYMVLSKTEKAMSYILKLKKLGTDFNRPLDIAEASVLQAVLEWATGYKQEAVDTLETTLTTMQKYDFVRVFADEGAAVLPILKRLALNLKKKSYHTTLDALFLNKVTIAAYEQSKRYKGVAVNIRSQKPVKLSKQQKLLVTLLSKGYKNAKIAEMTGLTIHTVKSHQAAAYEKLGVHNAMDAVIKAKELGLIE